MITKTDLAPYTDSDPKVIEENALKIKPDLTVFTTSCKTGEGLEQWIDWLRSRLTAKKQTLPRS